jgi:hypothetical protein
MKFKNKGKKETSKKLRAHAFGVVSIRKACTSLGKKLLRK